MANAISGVGNLNSAYGYGVSSINSQQITNLIGIDTTSTAQTVNSVADININNLENLFGLQAKTTDLNSVETSALLGLNASADTENLILGNTGSSGTHLMNLYNSLKGDVTALESFGYDQSGKLVYKPTSGSIIDILS